MGNVWQQQARTLGGDELVDKIEQMADDINQIKNSLADFTTRAFPAGDTDGHRRYHELMIRRTEEIRRLRIAVQEKTISGLVWGLLVGVAISVWHEITANISR